jgi:outer membrane protein insertion porin family
LDKRLLTNYYKNKGYYEVEVSSSNVEYSEGEGFILTFSINAGTRYKFKKIFANVSESLDKKPFIPLEEDFNNIIGDYYSLTKLTSLLEKIDKLSEKKELQFINHSVNETLVGDGIEVKINIFEGQKFLIERINIVGNSVTNDSVIRSELLVDEGDPFSTLLVNKSINRLKGRGIFNRVSKEITEGSLPDLKVLKISVEEKATGEIMAGAGVGTDGTAFMFALTENNWLGRGIRVEGGADISKTKISGNLSVVNPNYNYTGNVVYSSLDISSTDAKDTSGYESSKSGFSLGTKFEQYEDIFISPSIDISYEDISTDATATAAVKKMEGSFSNIDLGYGISLDKRNQTFQPTDGYKTNFIQTLPLIQDSSSILTGLSGSIYHSLSEDVVGSIKYYMRSVHGVDGDVRLTNRLFLPAKRLRGFQASKVGPIDGDDFVGGNYVTALGFEASLPNLLPETLKTDISVFLDTGNVWSVDYNESLDDSNKIRSSVGISANVFTVMGPLNFTLAQDLTKASTDLTERFNFRLGTSF